MTPQSGRFYGKVVYAAPEQLRSDHFDARTDLFALGLTLHEALTGRRVLNGDCETVMLRGMLPPIPKPSFLRPDVPPELDQLVMQMLEPLPVDRPASGAEVRDRLVSLLGAAAPFPGGQRALVTSLAGVRTVVSTPPSESATNAIAPPTEIVSSVHASVTRAL